MQKLWMVWGFLVLVMVACTPPTLSNDAAKALTTFSLGGVASPGTIDEDAHTVTVLVPFATDVTARVATFTTTGLSVSIGDTIQKSGTTTNNFTQDVVYSVLARDGTTQDYTIKTTEASLTANPTRLIYSGGYQGQVFEANLTGTGNDLPVADIDGFVVQAVFVGTDIYYLTYSSGYKVKLVVAGGADTELTGFDKLDDTSKLIYDGTDFYYTATPPTPATSPELYRMVPAGLSDDVPVTGFDRHSGSLYDLQFFKWDGSDWYYYSQDGSYSTWGVYKRVGTETNYSGANDVLMTGFDTVQVGPMSNDTTLDFYYATWGTIPQVFKWNASGTDTLVTGFDREFTTFLYNSGTFYSVVDGVLNKVVDGTGDDTLLPSVDANSHVMGISTYRGSLLAMTRPSSAKLMQIADGTDAEGSGFDNLSNNDYSVFDGTDYYYLKHDNALGKRVIMKKVGTETNGTGTNDIAVPGMDKHLGYNSYTFQVLGGVIYYQSGGTIYQLVGTETTLTGTNDVAVLGNDVAVVHFTILDGKFYYSDSAQNIWQLNATGTDVKLFNGSKIDGNMSSFVLFP